MTPSPYLVDILFPGEPTMTTQPSMNDLAAAYDAASLACDRAVNRDCRERTDESRDAARGAHCAMAAAETALLMAQRAAEVAS